MAKAKPGSGSRFKALSKKLKGRGVKNPDALAAYIGRKKYGKAKFQKLSAKGRKKLGKAKPQKPSAKGRKKH